MALDELDDEMLDSKDDQDTPEVSDSGPSIGSYNPPPSAAPKMNPMVQQYLQAQAQSNQNRTAAGFTAALSQIAHGISGAQGKADLSTANMLEQNADAPVKDLLTRQALAQKDMAVQKQALAADPTSPQSIAFRNAFKATAPKIAEAYGKDFDQLTAADAPNVMKLVTQKNANDLKEQLAGMHADVQKSARQEKADKEHDAYVTKVEDRARGWRGDPATTRFDQNLAAVSTADAILQKYRGREDEMPLQDIHALVADKLRAMTGAAPTEQEIKSQMPNTLSTKWSGTKSFFTGSPEPANAGDFVKSIDNYFKDIEKKSLAGIKNRQKSIVNNPRLTPEEKERIAEIGVPQPVYKDEAPVAAQPHPQDSQAVQWAKQHPTDPRAQKILQLNGAQ